MGEGLFYPFLALGAAFAAFAFCLRLLAGVFGRDRSVASAALAVALFLSACLEIFDLFAILDPEEMGSWRNASLLVEGALCPAWIWFTALFAREYEEGRLPWTQKGLICLSFVMPLWAGFLATQGMFYSPDFVREPVLFLEPVGFYFYIGLVLFAVASLFNIEATLANAVHFRRWKIKFTLLGAVAVLAALLLYYSQGLLYRSIDMTLVPARALALLLGAGLMWYSDVRRGSEIKISFSRRIAFKSLVLVVAGAYLVGLGIMGEGAKHFGDSLSRTMLLSAAFVVGIGLLAVCLSETVRRKARLFLQRNFYKEKYDYRVQWVQFTERLASARSQEDLHQASLSACCETFGIVGGALFLYDYGKKAFLPAVALEVNRHDGGFEETEPLVARLRRTQSVVALTDVPDEERGDSLWLKDDAVSFVIPLFREDNLDGFVLLGTPINSSEEYDEEDFELMDTMARHISSALLNMRLLDQLARSREMEIMGKVSTFVLHDLKNHVYTLSLMAENARKHIANPEFQKDLVESLGNTVGKMKILISQLKGLPDRQTLRRERVGLLSLAREATKLLQQDCIDYQGDDVQAWADSEEMGKVILNLCLNAIEASGNGKKVVVEAGAGDAGSFLRVVDFGSGISEEFLKNGLFLPFKSTKAKGMGIGLYQCKQIVEAHGGSIEVSSVPGEGSDFVVRLPRESAPSA